MNNYCNNNCNNYRSDHGPYPYVASIKNEACNNKNFRTAFWTGCNFQLTLMCIPVCGEIGVEMHDDTDQMIRVECGKAVVKIGCRKNQLNLQQNLCEGDVVFVPAGTWHNIINTGDATLKISSIYAPPHHKRGTVHKTKEDAEKSH